MAYIHYVTLKREGRDFFEGKAVDIIAKLNELTSKHGNDVSFEIDVFEEYGSYICEVLVQRPETAEETAKRQARTAEYEAKAKEQRRREFEILKKEFGE